ncbi:hypothetical protein KAW18_05805 [candidate division WOR-3 bacterium]|nr:hypothetical protein [candidate division WOR-3 bacterium]
MKNLFKTMAIFSKMIISLRRTIQIQREVDKIYPKVEKKIVWFGDG